MIEYLRKTFSQNDEEDSTLLSHIICLLIFISIVVVVIETEVSVFKKYQNYFYYFEFIFSAFFATEYILRIIFSGTNKKYQGLRGKIKFIFTPAAILDFLSFAPVLLLAMTTDTFLLRILRLMRLLRVIKFALTNRSIFLFLLALKHSKTQLLGTLVVVIFILFIGAVLLYLTERNIQPESFGSIPRAMWWAMATLTTVGYGDVYPVTVIGKLIASFVAILGIGIVALPAGIIAANFTKAIDDEK
jgi:voltage-gated potassium channel